MDFSYMTFLAFSVYPTMCSLLDLMENIAY